MRSKWKGPFVDNKIFKISQSILDKDKFWWDFKNVLVINTRRSKVLPSFESTKVKIYSGIKYYFLKIKDIHIGNSFGDFILTKKLCKFKIKKVNIKGKKK
jgi:ribosomal protein S19